SLKLDDRITNFILGTSRIDARLASVARIERDTEDLEQNSILAGLRERLRRFLKAHFTTHGSNHENIIFQISVAHGSVRHWVAMGVARDLGVDLVVGDVNKMLHGTLPFEEACWLLGREACLQSSVLCLESFGALLDDEHSRSKPRIVVETARTF